jgi:hypothetical protein
VRAFWPTIPTRRWWHYATTAPVVLAFLWWPFVRGTRVPILGWLDLAVHEFGHVATLWMPRALNLAMGNGVQVAVPLAIAAGLWWRSDDPLGAGLALGWAGTSAQDASVYIADAPHQQLPLIGGVHDWATLLGPQHLDAVYIADDLARLAWVTGLVLVLAGAALLGRYGWRAWQGRDQVGDAGPPARPRTTDWWTTAALSPRPPRPGGPRAG